MSDTSDLRSLSRLFAPRTIAVVGASSSANKAGGALMKVLQSFPGHLYPVNPSSATILGRPAFATVSDVPEVVDLVMIAVPPTAVPDVLIDCGAAGAGAAVICTGGFAESGAEGEALQRRIADVARASGLRVLGPNTSGFIVPAADLHATFMPAVKELPAGGLAIVAQSGGVNLASTFMASQLGVGISAAIGLGNAVDVGFTDAIDYLVQHEATRAIALHIEGVADGRALADAINRASRVKPVIALKVGKNDVGDFAQSHTGALAGNWAVARAALEQAGAVVVDSLSDLILASAALSVTRLTPHPSTGVGIVTGQAGPGLIIADTLASAGIRVPEVSPQTTRRLSTLLPPLTYQKNPIDTGRPDGSFLQVLDAVGEDPEVDALLVYALQEGGTGEVVDALADNAGQTTSVPTLLVTGGPHSEIQTQRARLRDVGVWTVDAPDRGAVAMAALVTDATTQHHLRSETRPALPPEPRLAGQGTLDEDEGKRIVADLGIRTPSRISCDSKQRAREAFAQLQKPVVVKVLDANVTHKSAAGGVRLNITTEQELDDALEHTSRASGADSARWLVEEQVPEGIELIIGGVNDASFGPAVIVGAGGISVEWAQPPIVRSAPLTLNQARQVITRLPVALRSALGGAVVDSLAETVASVAGFLSGHPEVLEMDINPLRVTPHGLIALDAVVRLDTITEHDRSEL